MAAAHAIARASRLMAAGRVCTLIKQRRAGVKSRTLATLCACIALAAIVYASVVPSSLRPHIFLPGPVEHILGYGAMMVVVAWALSNWRKRVIAAGLLVVGAGLLELSQLLVPGRDSQFIDFVASSIGIGVGLGAFAILHRSMRSRR